MKRWSISSKVFFISSKTKEPTFFLELEKKNSYFSCRSSGQRRRVRQRGAAAAGHGGEVRGGKTEARNRALPDQGDAPA